MILTLAYRYHRFLGIMFLTVLVTGLMKIDCSNIAGTKSNSSQMQTISGKLSSIGKATTWINSRAINPTELKGKVVLIVFGTYTCINWLRTLPYVRAWSEKYKDKGLVIIQVHTPEFPFEKNIFNVSQAIKRLQIDVPVAIDNDYDIWNAFENNYWPAFYFIDGRGDVRHQQFGEGEYERSEKVIQQLLSETGIINPGNDLVNVTGSGVELAADWSNLRSAENYLGYERTENAVNVDLRFEKPQDYTVPLNLYLNQWALGGNWTIRKQSIVSNKPGARIVYRFQARDLHLVMGSATGTSISFRVRINGEFPGSSHGIDIDENGHGKVAEHRMYQLIRQSKHVSNCLFEIEFADAGVQLFVVTFG